MIRFEQDLAIVPADAWLAALAQTPQTHKWCSRCATQRPRAEFYSDKRRKTGLSGWCRQCWREHFATNRESRVEYCAKNRARIAEYHREYCANNRTRITEYKREYGREYRAKNRERIREYNRNYDRKRRGREQ